ncbi:MAG: histidine--tRNA ligase [Defluviitaleaceae bacterium]|nr:histidine--tRNA ligase [Defluviitaleaceae bacterium]
MINTKVLSGFMELLPREQMEFDRMKTTIEETFRLFGFMPIDTPVIERGEVLLSKGSEEADKQIYFVTNGLVAKESNTLAMRFDLTVPLARYVAEHFNDLVFPFRRCHIGKSYRGERAQKGRFREFYQCDIDVVGSNNLSISYDAEIPAIIYFLFKKLNIGKFTIRISNRKVFNGLFSSLGITEVSERALQIIDKAEKVPREVIISDFESIGVKGKTLDTLLDFMAIKGDVSLVLEKLQSLDIDDETFRTGVAELKFVTERMVQMGAEKEYFTVDLSIVRGLDYYTGTVYETTMDDSKIGSVCGGGRYDNLAGNFTKEKLPGVGISIGLTRLFYQLRENGLLKFSQNTTADVIVSPDREENMPLAISAAQALRGAGMKVDMLLEENMPIKKKYRYIDKKNAPFTVVVKTIGGEEQTLSLQYKKDGEIVKEELTLEALLRHRLIHEPKPVSQSPFLRG